MTVVSRTKILDNKYNYTGYSRAITNVNGHACLPVYCRAEGIISVANKGEGLFAQPLDVQKSKLPPYFRVAIQSNGEEIQFFSYIFGTILGQTGPGESMVCLWRNEQLPLCFLLSVHSGPVNFDSCTGNISVSHTRYKHMVLWIGHIYVLFKTGNSCK